MAGLLRSAVLTLSLVVLAACGSSSRPEFRDRHERADAGHPDARPRVVTPASPLQCVPYARAQSGVEIYGNANTWWAKAAGEFARDDRPQVGAVLVLRGYNDPGRGHLAVVRRILNAREIVVDHANWLNRGEINLDTPVRDVSPGNDWSAVKVWYVPSNRYGARTYQVQGFILPDGLGRHAPTDIYVEDDAPIEGGHAGEVELGGGDGADDPIAALIAREAGS